MDKSDTYKYIVSGLERSGTSMMMQILEKGGASVAFNRTRIPDYHNPKGYYELAGGKIINQLIEGTFSFDDYVGTFVKITAYGLKYLPNSHNGIYKVVYMQRDLDEILSSMEKMSGAIDREKERSAFDHLNAFVLDILKTRNDLRYLIVNYRDIIKNPRTEIERINLFIGGMLDLEAAIKAVDPVLYRNVKK